MHKYYLESRFNVFSFPEMELTSDSGVDKELKVVLTDYKQEVSHVCLSVCSSGFPPIREIRENFEDFFQSGKSGKTGDFQPKSEKKI